MGPHQPTLFCICGPLVCHCATLDLVLMVLSLTQMLARTSLYVCFSGARFPEASAYFHEEEKEGLARLCQLALHKKYPKYATEGYEVLYPRPPVIYLSAAAKPNLAQFLCHQVLHLSAISSTPFPKLLMTLERYRFYFVRLFICCWNVTVIMTFKWNSTPGDILANFIRFSVICEPIKFLRCAPSLSMCLFMLPPICHPSCGLLCFQPMDTFIHPKYRKYEDREANSHTCVHTHTHTHTVHHSSKLQYSD